MELMFLILLAAAFAMAFNARSRTSRGSRRYTLTPSQSTPDGECMGHFVHWDGGLTRCQYPHMRCPNCWELTPEKEAARKARQEAEDAAQAERVAGITKIIARSRAERLKAQYGDEQPNSCLTGGAASAYWALNTKNPKPAPRKPMTPVQRERRDRRK